MRVFYFANSSNLYETKHKNTLVSYNRIIITFAQLEKYQTLHRQENEIQDSFISLCCTVYNCFYRPLWDQVPHAVWPAKLISSQQSHKILKIFFIVNLNTGMQTVRWEVIIDSKSRYLKLRVLAPGYQRTGTLTPCCRARLVA